MNREKLYQDWVINEFNENNYKLETVIENVWKILKSRFTVLDNKVFYNIKWDKLICKLSVISKNLKKITLENIKWELKSSLTFEYKWGCYYIDSLNSYENQRWNGRLILDLFLKTAKWKNIFLQDNAYAIDPNDEYSFLRLKNFYKKRWFKKSKIWEFQRCNVLFKWNVNEWRIYYKYS